MKILGKFKSSQPCPSPIVMPVPVHHADKYIVTASQNLATLAQLMVLVNELLQ